MKVTVNEKRTVKEAVKLTHCLQKASGTMWEVVGTINPEDDYELLGSGFGSDGDKDLILVTREAKTKAIKQVYWGHWNDGVREQCFEKDKDPDVFIKDRYYKGVVSGDVYICIGEGKGYSLSSGYACGLSDRSSYREFHGEVIINTEEDE